MYRVFKTKCPGSVHYVTILPFEDGKYRARRCLICEKKDEVAQTPMYRVHRLNNTLSELDMTLPDFYMDTDDFEHDYEELT